MEIVIYIVVALVFLALAITPLFKGHESLELPKEKKKDELKNRSKK